MKSKRIAFATAIAASIVCTGALATAASAHDTSVPPPSDITTSAEHAGSTHNPAGEHHAKHAHGKGTPAAIFFR